MEENSSQRQKLYQITNRDTGEERTVVSDNAQDACSSLGWLTGDCHFMLVRGHFKAGKDGEGQLLFEVPCEVCNFQWASCDRPLGQPCPCSIENPDLGKWLLNVTMAHLCEFVGQDLDKKDHQIHQKWVTLDQAVKELCPE